MVSPLLLAVLSTPPPLAQVTCQGLEAAYLADPPCCDGGNPPKAIAQSEQGERVEAYFRNQDRSAWEGKTLPGDAYWDAANSTVRLDLTLVESAQLVDGTTFLFAYLREPTPRFLLFAEVDTDLSDAPLTSESNEEYTIVVRI